MEISSQEWRVYMQGHFVNKIQKNGCTMDLPVYPKNMETLPY